MLADPLQRVKKKKSAIFATVGFEANMDNNKELSSYTVLRS